MRQSTALQLPEALEMTRRDIHQIHDFFEYVRTDDGVPITDPKKIDVAILDMNHSWPNVGHDSLVANQVSDNTAVGFRAAYSNTTGYSNTAIGNGALIANDTGWENTAIGDGALASNTASTTNTAVGVRALGGGTQGVFNTAIGYEAGYNVDGIGNVCIGAGVHGEAGELGITRIANIYSTGAASGRAVYVTSGNILGTLESSRRYKDEIKSMAEASEAIFSLRPVTFRYKENIDPARCLWSEL